MENQRSRSAGLQKKYNKIFLSLFILIVLVAGVLFYYNRRSLLYYPESKNPNRGIEHKRTRDLKTVIITGTNYSFNPKSITVNKGAIVTITFKITQGTHNLNIDAFNVHTLPLNNSQETLNFKASKLGSYEFYSSVGNDKSKGMIGKLLVQ